MGMHDWGISFPFKPTNHSLGNKAVWLVPKKYSTQNNPAMFVQYISPDTVDYVPEMRKYTVTAREKQKNGGTYNGKNMESKSINSNRNSNGES